MGLIFGIDDSHCVLQIYTFSADKLFLRIYIWRISVEEIFSIGRIRFPN